MFSTLSRILLSYTAQKRMMEIAGLGLFLAAFISIGALMSYHPGDPSLNHVAQGGSVVAVKNWMGETGATMADILLQLFGWATLFLVIASIGWGWRLVRKEIGEGTWVKLLALMV